MNEKRYTGYRLLRPGEGGHLGATSCGVNVQVGDEEYELIPRLDIRNHSPDGFEWGYCGSGPAQLALALVADAMGREYAVPTIYQRVKRALVAGLAYDGWSLPAADVRSAVAAAMAAAGLTYGDLVDQAEGLT